MHFHDLHIASLIIILALLLFATQINLVLHFMLIVYITCTLFEPLCDRSDLECLNLCIKCLQYHICKLINPVTRTFNIIHNSTCIFVSFLQIISDFFGSPPSPEIQHLLPPEAVTISKTDRHQNKLGEGSYAKVYRGQYNGLPCAVKVFNKDCLKEELSDPGHGFEIAYLKGMTHENIVKVYGLWIDPYKGRDITAIVMELCEDSLEGYINKNRIISIDKKLQILNGVCKGMIFLHNEGIVHGDLRASNILLVQSFNQIIVKVSDFGMFRYVDPQTIKHSTLTHTDEDYLPPEVFHERHQRTPKQKFACLTFAVDTFCFGTLALQLGSGEFPTPSKKVETRFRMPTVRTEVERRSSYLKKLKQSDKEVIDPIVRRCLADKPEDRPSFTDLHTTIETKLRRYTEQLELQVLKEKIVSHSILPRFHHFRLLC